MKLKLHTRIVLLAGLLSLASGCADERGIFVSPQGRDTWSGRRAEPKSDGSDGPLATLPAAVAAARKAAAAGAPETVWLRGGTYELAAPLVLAPEDSGLTVAAYRDEKPVLSGGRRLTDWQPVAGKPAWWQTTVPVVREGKWYFRSLFVNGRRAQRARTPNEGFFRIQGASPQDQPVKLHFKPGDIKPEWAAAGDVEVIALLAWADFRMFIRSVDEANSVATLSTSARPSNKENDARYFIENAPDALDAPGEWYLDRKTGVVTYIARPGEDLRTAEVVAPRLEELVRLQGDFSASRPVSRVVFRGVTFSDTDWTMPDDGYTDTQAAVAVPGDVRAEGATDCAFEGCTFTRLSGYAVDLGRGCQRDRVVGCELSDLGAGGVRIGEPGKRTTPFEQNHSHIVTDNHIHHGGLVYSPAVGVFILQSGTNVVAHNEIDHLYYTAISAGWNWGYQETPCRANVIEFNHLHDIGQGMLSDMGAFYSLGIQKGTVIRNNLVHDVESFGYGGWGLYTDEGSTDIVLENNVVYRCKSAGFHQHYGRENVVRNNVFALNREHQLMRTRDEEHLSFFFTNNIVYFETGDLLGSSWKNDRFVIDENVYWDARPGAAGDTLRFAGATLDQWRQRGHDTHSVIADPLFVAPKQGDFRLQPGSPALKRGFRPIDLSTVGPRKTKQGLHDRPRAEGTAPTATEPRARNSNTACSRTTTPWKSRGGAAGRWPDDPANPRGLSLSDTRRH